MPQNMVPGTLIEFEPIPRNLFREGFNNPIVDGDLIAEVIRDVSQEREFGAYSRVRFFNHRGNDTHGTWNIDLHKFKFKVLQGKKRPRYKEEREYVT